MQHTLTKHIIYSLIAVFCLSSCFYPPFDRFHQKRSGYCASLDGHRDYKAKRKKLALQNGIDLSYSRLSHITSPDKQYITRMLGLNNIQVIQYRDTITLMVPTDEYYLFDSPKLNDIRYHGLNYIIDLIMLSPCTTIYVAAFSDNIGSRKHKNELTQAQAETMVGFLWANGIPSAKLHPQGMGSKYPIADQKTIRGSAMNRHIEIQWTTSPDETLENSLKAIK